MSDQTPKEDELTAEEWAELRQQIAEDRNALFDQVAALTARCEALEQERQRQQNKADVRGNMLRYIAFVTTGDEYGDAQLGVDRIKERCEALAAERDTLRQKLSDADEIRVSFAAGYTAALDDALKGTK